MNAKQILASMAGAIVVVGGLSVAPAAARAGDVRVNGTCTGGSTSKLKLGARDGAIELEFEVDSNVTGQTWRVTITDNGNQVFQGNRVTRDPSGSFTLRRTIPDRAGSDKVVARARNAGSGEVCRAVATI